ncbi:MAG: hypothetical protein IPL49_21855 [Saprospirales bacterium]|nr:hypothetical protein [Saprospirales bacterium]
MKIRTITLLLPCVLLFVNCEKEEIKGGDTTPCSYERLSLNFFEFNSTSNWTSFVLTNNDEMQFPNNYIGTGGVKIDQGDDFYFFDMRNQ